jgi:hypothetical protein
LLKLYPANHWCSNAMPAVPTVKLEASSRCAWSAAQVAVTAGIQRMNACGVRDLVDEYPLDPVTRPIEWSGDRLKLGTFLFERE